MENKPVVLIVEDEPAAMARLAPRLEAEGYRVLPALSGREAMAQAASYCPDLVLLTLELPDMDGLEVIDFLRDWSSLPIIAMAAQPHEDALVRALDRGADDYVEKPISPPALLARMRAALRRGSARRSESGPGPQTFGSGSLSIDYAGRRVQISGRLLHLTPIEYRILTLLARNAGQVMSHKQLRQELWGPYADDNRLLRVNMANLRRKIEHNPAEPRFIRTEVGVGYRMVEGDARPLPPKIET